MNANIFREGSKRMVLRIRKITHESAYQGQFFAEQKGCSKRFSIGRLHQLSAEAWHNLDAPANMLPCF